MPMTAWRIGSSQGYSPRAQACQSCPLECKQTRKEFRMNSLKPVFTVSHPAAGLKRLLIAALAVLLLGVFTALPALASGSGTWTLTGSMHLQRWQDTATLLPNGQVLVAGGFSPNPISSAELYTPSTGTWTVTGNLHTGRSDHSATLLSNGQVLVAGGQSTSNFGCPGDTASAEVYTPTTGAWSTTGSLNQARDGHTATLLTNGQVLVAGGEFNEPDCVSTTFLNSAELYTP